MNSYNNKNHNNNIKNNNNNYYFYDKAASIYSGFDLIVISLEFIFYQYLLKNLVGRLRMHNWVLGRYKHFYGPVTK